MLVCALTACASVPPAAPNRARFVEWPNAATEGLPPQRITIWLPPGYDTDKRRYPVLYMLDGQNLFDPANAHYGKVWHIDDVLTRMVAEGEASPHIVVGIWSPDKERYRLYLPQPAADGVTGEMKADVERMSDGPNLSARELEWLTGTVKPRIDREFRTRSDPADTTIIGSSMGGIMACYAAIERPRVFGRAGCVSAHWPIASPDLAANHRAEVDAIWRDWLARNAEGTRKRPRLWLDHGTVGMDGNYEPYQQSIARDLAALGWRQDHDFAARIYSGAEHDEIAWNARLPDMLAWLWRAE